MSYFTFNNGEIILHDVSNQPRSLVEFGNIAANQSDMLQINLVNEVNSNLHKLFDKTAGGALNSIIYLRLVAELMRKPQKHDVLHFGQWSPLDDTLAFTLPKFNAKNFLWYYAPVRPVGKFSSVNFIFAEVNGGGISFRKTNSVR
ncbi:MAG: hypothetical protein IKO74_03405 [Selenomonadaceae bacterium]|nr:hypothetical protein [Selenomonadaceae bacterium]